MSSIGRAGRRPPRSRRDYPTRPATPPSGRCSGSWRIRGICGTSRTAREYVFLPTVGRDKARRSALRQLVQTFFEGSTAQAVAALLGEPGANLSDDDLERLSRLIDQARKEGR